MMNNSLPPGPGGSTAKKPFFSIKFGSELTRVVAFVFAFTGFVLSCVAVESCQFFEVERLLVTDANSDGGGDVLTGKDYYGLFSAYVSGICISYGDSDFEDFWRISSSDKAAQAFGILAAIFGGIIMIILGLSFFMAMPFVLWRVIGGLLVANIIFQSFTMMVFNSDRCKDDKYTPDPNFTVSCHVYDGGAFAIAAMTCYLLASFMVFCGPNPEAPMVKVECAKPVQRSAPPPPPMPMQPYTSATMGGMPPPPQPGAMVPMEVPMEEQPPVHTSMTTRTVNPDGSITTETMNPDGSKTVTMENLPDDAEGGGAGYGSPGMNDSAMGDSGLGGSGMGGADMGMHDVDTHDVDLNEPQKNIEI